MQKFRKAIASLSVVAILSSFAISTAFAGQYNDVPEDAYYYTAVEQLVADGVLDDSKDDYEPGVSLQRDQAAKLLVIAADKEDTAPEEASFLDVPTDHWSFAYVEAAYAHGIVNGYTDPADHYGPGDLVTREQFAKMAVLAFDLETYEPSTPTFSDVTEDMWSYPYVETAYHYQVVDGVGGGDTFNPGGNVNRADAALITYTAKYEAEPREEEEEEEEEEMGGDVLVELSSDTPDLRSVPNGTSVEFLALDFTAGDEDAAIRGITFTAGGLGTQDDVNAVVMYHDGKRLGSVKDINSNGVASINLTTPLEIEAGDTETVMVKATILAGQTGQYLLKIEDDDDINADGDVDGDFPIEGELQGGVTVTVGTLTMNDDGSPSDVNLGDDEATIAKFELEADGEEDITMKSIVLRRAATSTASDDDFENLELWHSGDAVASAEDGFENKYATFVFEDDFVIEKNDKEKFQLKADIVGGAGKAVTVELDNVADIEAIGNTYDYQVIAADNFTGNAVNIDAGDVIIEKENSASDTIRPDKKDVEFGAFLVTANSGVDVELSSASFTITTTNDNQGASSAFDHITSLEIYNETNNTVYDLAYVSGTAAKVYSNTSMDLILEDGEENRLVFRADVEDDATTEDYQVAINDASTDLTMKEVDDDTAVTDITPNTVTLKKLTVETTGVTFSTNALSSTYNAVVGTEDIKILSFNIKASDNSDLNVEELKFKDADGGSTVDKTLVSGFKLFKDGEDDPVKEKSANDLNSSEEITFDNIDLSVSAGETDRYYLTVSLVNDSTNNGESLRFRISGYDVEDDDNDAVYDATADDGAGGATASDGTIAATEAGATSLLSARTVEVKGEGALLVAMDNSNSATDQDLYGLGGEESPYWSAIKLRAENEDVKIKDFTVTSSYASIGNVVETLYLYEEGESEPIATETNVVQVTTFEDIDYIVGQTSTTLLVKADLTPIGKDEAGVLDQSALTWTVTAITAEGDASAAELADGDVSGGASDNTGVDPGEICWDYDGDGYYDDANDTVSSTIASNELGVLASMIDAVSFVSSYSGTIVATELDTTGEYNAAILKVETAAHTNTLASGDVLKTLLTQVRLSVTKYFDTSVSGVTLEKIGGVGDDLDATLSYTTYRITLTNAADGDNEWTLTTGTTGAQTTGGTTCVNLDSATACAAKLETAIDGLTGLSADVSGAVVTVYADDDELLSGVTHSTINGTTSDIDPGDFYAVFDTSHADFSTDDELGSDSSANYLVKVTLDVMGSGTSDDWIRVSMHDLNGDADGANFTWKDGSDASAKYPLRLEGISNIDGTKISEQD